MINHRLTTLLHDVLATTTSMNALESTKLFFGENTNEQFGDYQTNAAMILAKPLKKSPQEIANSLITKLETLTADFEFSIAGPGFINAFITKKALWNTLNQYMNSPTLGAVVHNLKDTIVVDYSHPNLAKEMHVGHLRSTIIGDSIVKVLEFLEYRVIRQNHMGDWGTQFGMLIAYFATIKSKGDTPKLKDLEEFYRSAKKEFDANKKFATLSRDYTVKLQHKNEECLKLWREFITISINHCNEIYKTLGVSLSEQDVYPESKYNDDLPVLIKELDDKGLIVESDGAKCVFLEEFRKDDDRTTPIIVQKNDGGYLYATTDLAAIRYRANILKAKRVLYVVDARQSLHLEQVFTLARKADFLTTDTTLEHLSFGTMMGSDGKPFKTRAGFSIKLMDLLKESTIRAKNTIAQKSPHIVGEERDELAHILGIGSVKYADLSKNRTGDYIFDLDAMLSFEGNTAPYLLYAYTRINSIFTKAGIDSDTITCPSKYDLTKLEERRLALQLIRFCEVVTLVSESGMSNMLCNYLYTLAKKFMSFYEVCPVLKEDETTKYARLYLCKNTAITLKTGLQLLGIDTPHRM